MAKVHLLRHGQTAWNKNLIFRGQYDIPLDDHGLTQADCAGRVWEEIQLANIYSSPLSRAMQTAETAAKKQAIPITKTPELIDIDYGQWTGKSQDKIEKDYPELNRQWLERPEEVRFPQGESLAAVRDRSCPKLVEIAGAADDKSILIASHRVVLKVLICAALDLPLSRFWQVQIDTASLSMLSFKQGGFTIQKLNDTCHLRSLGLPTESVDF